MQAIKTKWIAGTNTKPNRIKAYCVSGSFTIGADSTQFSSHDERAHLVAAKGLQDKLKWKGELLGGDTKEGFCFVFVPLKLQDYIDAGGWKLKSMMQEYYK